MQAEAEQKEAYFVHLTEKADKRSAEDKHMIRFGPEVTRKTVSALCALCSHAPRLYRSGQRRDLSCFQGCQILLSLFRFVQKIFLHKACCAPAKGGHGCSVQMILVFGALQQLISSVVTAGAVVCHKSPPREKRDTYFALPEKL